MESTIIEDECLELSDLLKNYSEMKKNNVTNNKLTKFEKASIIGIRAQQLTMGCKPLIEIDNTMDDVVKIAEKELELKKTPFIIRRRIAHNFEYWKIEDLYV